MTDARAWPIRPKWHRFESPRSYAQRQCEAARVPFDYVERGLTTEARPYIYRVWVDEAGTASTIEAAAGRPEGHYLRLKRLAQPKPHQLYSDRFLCRLCAAGDRVQQIPHDRENWCLRHPGQLVWTGPGTTPESQRIFPFDRELAKAEHLFRHLVAIDRVDARMHARVWEMVRDNAWLTQPDGWKPALAVCREDHEVRGRAELYPETIAVLAALSNADNVARWSGLPADELRPAILEALPPMAGAIRVLVERIVLWLRPRRRAVRPTRIDPLSLPLDIVDTSAIIDSAAAYPLWIQRRPRAVGEWDWGRNDEAHDPWEPRRTSVPAWWVCDEGHSWETTPYVRAIAGCPHCAGLAVWRGQSDLGTQFPDLAAEWDKSPGANAGGPDDVGPGSNRRVKWVCRRGHRWVATINNRARNGSGCPYCANKRAIPGETDLATLRPDLAAEWDHDRNGKLTPHVVGARTTRRAWWAGQCGHNWQASIANRTRGNGCPYCAGKRALPGVTDLGTLRPDLAAQWHISNELRPEQVRPSAGKKVAWQCEEGHVWEAAIYSRSSGSGCPYCAGKLVVPGKTDLATLRPELVPEWDASNALSPHEVTAHSKHRAMWKCVEGHVWAARVFSRTSRRGSGCPLCNGHQVVPGVNDLSTLRPDLAVEWDVSNRRAPGTLRPTSTIMAAWRCPKGHLWKATVASRSSGRSCPSCPAPACVDLA